MISIHALRCRLRSLWDAGYGLSSIHNLLLEHSRAVRELKIELAALYELQRRPRYGTVILLWRDESGAPCCGSSTVELQHREQATATIQAQRPVPAGAWVVSVDCYLRNVMVGADCMDLAMPDRSRLCVLALPVHVGVHVRCVLLA